MTRVMMSSLTCSGLREGCMRTFRSSLIPSANRRAAVNEGWQQLAGKWFCRCCAPAFIPAAAIAAAQRGSQ